MNDFSWERRWYLDIKNEKYSNETGSNGTSAAKYSSHLKSECLINVCICKVMQNKKTQKSRNVKICILMDNSVNSQLTIGEHLGRLRSKKGYAGMKQQMSLTLPGVFGAIESLPPDELLRWMKGSLWAIIFSTASLVWVFRRLMKIKIMKVCQPIAFRWH